MLLFEPEFTITPAILRLSASVAEKAGRLSARGGMETEPGLRRRTTACAVAGTLNVEAPGLTADTVLDVMDNRPAPVDMIAIREIKNACRAYGAIGDFDPLSLEHFCRVHALLTEGLTPDGGQLRRDNARLFPEERQLYGAAAPVADRVQALLKWLGDAGEALTPPLASTILHGELCVIHPFNSANGRFARLWQAAYLCQCRGVYACVPFEAQLAANADRYYETLMRAINGSEREPFIEFMLTCIDRSLDDVEARESVIGAETSEYIRRLLNAMEPGVHYTATAIMARLHLKSRENFRRNYMEPALAQGFVAMDDPEHPTNRNQRYSRK